MSGKVVVAAEYSKLGRFVSTEFYNLLTGMSCMYGWEIRDYTYLQEIISILSDIRKFPGPGTSLILFELWREVARNLKPLEEFREEQDSSGNKKNKLVMFADDIHWFDQETISMKVAAFSICDYVICTNPGRFKEYYPDLIQSGTGREIPVYGCPHSVTEAWFRPLNTEPLPRVILSTFKHYVYQFRMAALEQAKAFGLPIDRLPHPGYEPLLENKVDMADMIYPYIAGLTCGGTTRYVVAKHYEIPAVGLLLITCSDLEPELKELGFVDNVHYIGATKETLRQTVEWVTNPDNRLAVDEIRSAGQRLVRERHLLSHRIDLLNEIVSGRK